MFRFSIREMVLSMVIVAVAGAWWVDRRELTKQLIDSQKWQTRAGALEFALKRQSCQVQWHDSTVFIDKGKFIASIETSDQPPDWYDFDENAKLSVLDLSEGDSVFIERIKGKLRTIVYRNCRLMPGGGQWVISTTAHNPSNIINNRLMNFVPPKAHQD